MAEALLINREDLVRRTPLSGNIDFDKVVHYIQIAQDIYIQELLGTKLYNKIQSDILGNVLAGDYLDLVKNYVRPILAQYTFLEFLPFAQYSLNNKGIFKHTSEAAELPGVNEIVKMQEATRDTAQHYSKRLVDYLCAFPNKFPEYLTNNLNDVRPTKDITFGGWQI